MTFNEAMSAITSPHKLNTYDAQSTGYQDTSIGEETRGYRIYIIDDAGYRYSATMPQLGRKDDSVENNVFYWYNKYVAEAYMAYLADAMPQYTYGLFEVEAIKGAPLWGDDTHYGQVAQTLIRVGGAPIKVLTPDMINEARQNPDVELFSE